MSHGTTVTHRRRGLVRWAAVNLVLGYVAVVPVVTAMILGSYVRAGLWGTVAAPFDREEAVVAAVIVVVVGGVLAVSTVLVNRAIRRRGGVGLRPLTFVTATAGLQLLPSLVFLLATDRTVYGMLGRGLFW